MTPGEITVNRNLPGIGFATACIRQPGQDALLRGREKAGKKPCKSAGKEESSTKGSRGVAGRKPNEKSGLKWRCLIKIESTKDARLHCRAGTKDK
jgi:hypothetical protein